MTVAGFCWSLQFTHGRIKIKRHNILSILALFVLSGGPLEFCYSSISNRCEMMIELNNHSRIELVDKMKSQLE